MAWNGVGPLAGNENTGYCTHASNIFTTWHRPYLGLFEQSLYANVLEVVNQFQGTQRERYARAAATLRMPYLDVARNGRPTALPDIVSRARIWCDTPAGRREIPNPLYSYRFNPLGQLGARQAPFTVYPATLRHPSSTAPDAVSRNEIARQRLDNARISLRDRIHVLFRTYTNFNQFGNSAWYPDNSGRYDSVESVHDVVHGMVGGGGHMGFVDYSAMDPFFWLHHTNIDRLLAMFQVLNPNSYVQPQAQRSRTFTTRAGAVLDVNSALTPFRSNINGGFWTSASVRQTTVLGYNYVETASNANRDTVTAAINSLYGRTTTARRRRRDLSATPTATSTAATNGTLPNTNGTMPLTNGTLAENEYFANIASLKHGVGGTYSIYVFLSEPSKNPSEWPVQKSLVGTHVVFAPTADSASAMADIKTSGTVPLDSCLYDEVERGRLASLEEKDVLPFLHRELQYRCSLVSSSVSLSYLSTSLTYILRPTTPRSRARTCPSLSSPSQPPSSPRPDPKPSSPARAPSLSTRS